MAVSIIPAILMIAVLFQAPQAAPPAPVIPPGPTDFALTPKGAAQNWPMFRGPQASGVADAQGALVEWDVKAGKNIRWKTPIPGFANSSPVIWGNRIYVATADSTTGVNTFQAGNAGINSLADTSEHTWKLYALDATSGASVWEKEVHKGVPRTKRHPKGSQAAASPVTDGRRVAVLFGTAGILATYDVNGAQLWKKDLGTIDNGYVADPTQQWGHSASPILYENSVIIQADQQKGSYIAAYDIADGKELWKTIREDEISTWGTPLVVKGESGDELITNGTKVRGYDPKTGKIRWALGPNSQVVIPTPIAGNGLVYVVRAGKEYVQIAVNEMAEPITATPAIADGLMVVRTVRAVYGIGTR